MVGSHQPAAPDGPRAPGGLAAAGVAALIIAATVVGLHGPVGSLTLTGDSYQWVQLAHAAAHRSGLLLADLDGFFRPSATWVLVVDRFLWGGFNAHGYRVSSLILHGLAGFALWLAARRLDFGPVAAEAMALVWLTSPFTDESVFVVACQHEPLLLLPWLGLVCIWPRAGCPWSGPRLAAAGVMIVLAAAAKETWVVTPLLVAALEIERSRSLRSAIRPAIVVTTAVAAYLVFYAVAIYRPKSYFELGQHIVAKIPAQLAAFLYFEAPATSGIALTWLNLLATVVVAAMVVTCLKWRASGTMVALALLLLPTLPTLLVPYTPPRYLAIPFAGFVLLAGVWLRATVARLGGWRWRARTVVGVGTVLVVAAGAVSVRADLEDYRRVAKMHGVLLEEAARVKDVVAGGSRVVVVRDEQMTPLLELVETPVGQPKLVFVRNHDPYGLIDAAALFEWVIADEGTRVEHVRAEAGAPESRGAQLLVHRVGGFVDLGKIDDVAAEVERWSEAGRGVQIIRAVPLAPSG